MWKQKAKEARKKAKEVIKTFFLIRNKHKGEVDNKALLL